MYRRARELGFEDGRDCRCELNVAGAIGVNRVSDFEIERCDHIRMRVVAFDRIDGENVAAFLATKPA